MVVIIEDFIPRGRNRPGYKMTPRYITIHDTANPNIGVDARSCALPERQHRSGDPGQLAFYRR